MEKINKIAIFIENLILILIIVIHTLLYIQFKENNITINVSANEEKIENGNKLIQEENIDLKNTIIENSKLTDWNLILVNKNNYIPEGFTVKTKEIEDSHYVDERIAENLEQMLNDARSLGLDPIICSSYRTQEKQEELYNAKTEEYKNKGYKLEEAKELASYWVAIPGTGEHQTGLAVDIVSEEYQILDEKQEETQLQQWLINNSYKYGFILRYPTEKKDITMINYEPWHYRYVGIENATFMKEKGMCFEEFINYLKIEKNIL